MSLNPIVPNAMSNPKPIGTKWARMRFWLLALLTIQSCGLDIEDPTPPSLPVWVQKSFPEEWPERGIDANESGGISLQWQANPLEDNIVEYNIYRAVWHDANDSLDEYEWHAVVKASSLSQYEYSDDRAVAQVTYQYKIQAEDGGGGASEFSNIQEYTLLLDINYEQMIPNNFSSQLCNENGLCWVYRYNTEMENYTITVLTEENQLIIREIFSPQNYTGGREYWYFPTHITLDSGNVYKWRIDMNARFVGEVETSGAESEWATFLYLDS
jgi:hypothetical protein